ncbi:hypothetical protein FJ930_23550 [Mesorhizobium sp. B2-4-15]|uniref:hypothetical protein n=1 Tax=Mesorhizobium sp. B2-4-15 TaxID=2589934 RepID=UPI001153A8CF|nr:hypothetical protein [Mesorhizobium sp. B2-4-15]TPK66918.1 hypothetical protein FJ930_23550 [Mesorhizobium sp. B2-4-15]
MSTSATSMAPSTSVYATPAFWQRFWRTSGIQAAGLFVIAYVIVGSQPPISASDDVLVAFYDGHRTKILVAAMLSGLAVLNLLWFAAALRATLADRGQDGWGAAATAASAMLGALLLLQTAVAAALAYRLGGSQDHSLVSGLNAFAWTLGVLTSFPRAMLIMSGAFGLWRAGLISSALFAAGVAVVVLGVLGGTTWLSDGIWAPDGAYSRLVSPLLLLLWILVVSRVLLSRAPATGGGWW